MALLNKNANRQKCVIFVDRNSLTFHIKANQKPHILELGPEIVKDMEVVSPEKYIASLAGFMDTNKIPSCDSIVVLSENVYFEHAVQSISNSDADEKELELFLGSIPFAQTVSRIIADGASKRAVVINRDYYDLLLEFLEKRYFRVLALFPSSLIKVKVAEEVKVDKLIKNLDDYRKYNFLGDFERKYVPQSFIAKNTPKDTKNLKIMSAFFAILILILLAMVYLNFFKK